MFPNKVVIVKKKRKASVITVTTEFPDKQSASGIGLDKTAQTDDFENSRGKFSDFEWVKHPCPQINQGRTVQ